MDPIAPAILTLRDYYDAFVTLTKAELESLAKPQGFREIYKRLATAANGGYLSPRGSLVCHQHAEEWKNILTRRSRRDLAIWREEISKDRAPEQAIREYERWESAITHLDRYYLTLKYVKKITHKFSLNVPCRFRQPDDVGAW